MTSLRHRLCAGGEPVRFIGVYDGLSGYLAERSGAAALWASGLCISASKALPDGEVVTYESLVRRAEDIRRGTRLPILVDGNTGFGDLTAVRHVVRLLEDRHIDGVCLEDKAFPRRNSFADGPTYPLEAPERFAEKLSAAVSARRGRDFLIVARTEGFIAGESQNDVLRRARLYQQAGADAIVVHSKSKDGQEVLSFAKEWARRIPLIVIPTTYPALSFRDAGDHGIGGAICANQLMRVSVQAIRTYLSQLAVADRMTDCDTDMAPLETLLDYVQGLASDGAGIPLPAESG
ncbi:isocitrate lyase/phosphoenolpyruvate mutase family protein [Streptomyces sp. NPDC001401]|uniref:isocitrate lyase/phosphoenolpyruvate mutase family protein n=1 Tax=Streptomyces sp. NPDC001401 TaxID=3364570 RepID=UPI0036C8FAD7